MNLTIGSHFRRRVVVCVQVWVSGVTVFIYRLCVTYRLVSIYRLIVNYRLLGLIINLDY